VLKVPLITVPASVGDLQLVHILMSAACYTYFTPMIHHVIDLTK
jgi:hypothetical protein